MEPIPITNPFPGAASFFMSETSSTMDEARKLVRLGFPRGTTIMTDCQTEGRGRFPERRWEAEAGQNILATLILGPEAAALPGFPLRIGLALCRSLELFAIQSGLYPPFPPALKWPNDVLINNKKLVGILCEASAEATYVGFGINVNQRSFPPSIAKKATSLALALARPPEAPDLDRYRLLELCLDQIALAVIESTWREEAEALLWNRGERVRFLEGLPETSSFIEGRLVGLAPSGGLIIETDGRKTQKTLMAGELIVPEASRVDRGAPII